MSNSWRIKLKLESVRARSESFRMDGTAPQRERFACLARLRYTAARQLVSQKGQRPQSSSPVSRIYSSGPHDTPRGSKTSRLGQDFPDFQVSS